jgi:hypothetical protein
VLLVTRVVPEHATSPVAALGVPYGLAWALIGVRMTVRGSPTLVDPVPAVEARRSVGMEIPG